MLKNVLTVQIIFKIFLQNYSLSITNAHRSLGKRLWGRWRGIGESSGFSHPLGRVGGTVVIGGGGDNLSCVKSPSF